MPSGLFDRVVVVCDVFDFGLEFVVRDVLGLMVWFVMFMLLLLGVKLMMCDGVFCGCGCVACVSSCCAC